MNFEEQKLQRWREGQEQSVIPDLGLGGSLYTAILQLFKELLCTAKLQPLIIPSDLYLMYVQELQRFYLWGEGVSASEGRLDSILDMSEELRHDTLFILEQMSRVLSTDLYGILDVSFPSDSQLTPAVNEVMRMQKDVAYLFHTTEDADPDNGLAAKDEANTIDADEILIDVTTYIDSLMDLCDVLENPAQDWLDDKDAAVTPEVFNVLPEADSYCRRIRDRYASLPMTLVERFGNLNAKRYSQLRMQETLANMKNPIQQNHLELDQSSKPSVSGDRTIETSLPSMFDEETDHGDTTSISTFGTTESVKSKGRPRVPPLPVGAREGAHFRCPVCSRSVSGITSRAEWKKHVFADLRSYCCILEDCNVNYDGDLALTTYESASAWLQHLKSHSAATANGVKCPFCGPDSLGLAPRKIVRHIRRHLQEISLAALPPGVADDTHYHDVEEHEDDNLNDDSEENSEATVEDQASEDNYRHPSTHAPGYPPASASQQASYPAFVPHSQASPAGPLPTTSAPPLGRGLGAISGMAPTPPYGHHQFYLSPSQHPSQQEHPFKCDQCPQSFNRNHDLKRHKRIHLSVKPFPCLFCDKSFSRKDALKRHKLVKGCGGDGEVKNSEPSSEARADENTG